MKNFKYCLLLFALALPGLKFSLFAQDSVKVYTPTIGEKLPDYTFTDLRNHPNKTLSLNELRGQWVILDFWSMNCSGCLKSFPKMNELHQKFKDKVKVIMVGEVSETYLAHTGKKVEKEKPTKKLYERLENLYNLTFTVSFDKYLKKLYDLDRLPYIIVLDPQGFVRAITTSINDESINLLIAGKRAALTTAYTNREVNSINQNLARKSTDEILQNNRTDNRIHQIRSSISLYERETMPPGISIDLNDTTLKSTKRALDEGILESNMAQINSLFFIAHFGKLNWHPSDTFYYRNYSKEIIFETTDSLRFMRPRLTTTRFAYTLAVPPERATIPFLQLIMQKDLEVYFGLVARMESKEMPVMYLKVVNKALTEKLQTRGKDNRFEFDQSIPYQQIIINNKPLQHLCNLVGGFTGLNIPILDMTGLNMNIDIDLRTYIYDLESIENALKSYGLTLIEGTKRLNTLIISDSPTFRNNHQPAQL